MTRQCITPSDNFATHAGPTPPAVSGRSFKSGAAETDARDPPPPPSDADLEQRAAQQLASIDPSGLETATSQPIEGGPKNQFVM